MGLTVAVTGSVIRGLFHGGDDPFVRTPKKGEATQASYRAPIPARDLILKLSLGVVMVGYLAGALAAGFYGSVPFIVLFGSGYLGLGLKGLDDLGRLHLGRLHASPGEPRGIVGKQSEDRRPEQQAGPHGLQARLPGSDTSRGPSSRGIRARLGGSSPGSRAGPRTEGPRARTRGGRWGKGAGRLPGSKKGLSRHRTTSRSSNR